jgi:hypothetical protein
MPHIFLRAELLTTKDFADFAWLALFFASVGVEAPPDTRQGF